VLRKYADDAERVAQMLLNAKKEHKEKIEKSRQEMRVRIKQKLEEVIKKEEDEVENQKQKKKELEQTGTDLLEKTIVVKDEVASVAEKTSNFSELLKPLTKSLDVFL
jgi:BioD-like phosphotransacetylase family protein